MRENSFLTGLRLSNANVGMITRSRVALFATLSLVLASLFLGVAQASASGIIETQTQATPWAIVFDKSGHVWVAEPGCDAEPNCGSSFQSYIGEYNGSNDTLVKNFFQPQGYSSPVFLIIDGKGNIWFSEPTSNAIGKLTPSGPKWQQWKVPSSNASPYGLTFDNNGNIWFTEFSSNKIGFFNTKTNQIVENTIPTSGSHPYGITKDPGGKIWFAENGQQKIASFVPTSNGKASITEYGVGTAGNPHLITADHAGNIWYSEGFSGDIGEYIPSTKVHKNINVANGVSSTHISGITVDSKGRIWFDDSLSARIGAYTPSSGALKTLALSNHNAHPYDGLALDGSSNTWFTEEYASPNGMLGRIPAGTL